MEFIKFYVLHLTCLRGLVECVQFIDAMWWVFFLSLRYYVIRQTIKTLNEFHSKFGWKIFECKNWFQFYRKRGCFGTFTKWKRGFLSFETSVRETGARCFWTVYDAMQRVMYLYILVAIAKRDALFIADSFWMYSLSVHDYLAVSVAQNWSNHWKTHYTEHIAQSSNPIGPVCGSLLSYYCRFSEIRSNRVCHTARIDLFVCAMLGCTRARVCIVTECVPSSGQLFDAIYFCIIDSLRHRCNACPFLLVEATAKKQCVGGQRINVMLSLYISRFINANKQNTSRLIKLKITKPERRTIIAYKYTTHSIVVYMSVNATNAATESHAVATEIPPESYSHTAARRLLLLVVVVSCCCSLQPFQRWRRRRQRRPQSTSNEYETQNSLTLVQFDTFAEQV